MIITEIEPPNVHMRAKNCGTSYEMETEKGWKIKYSAVYRDVGKTCFSKPCFDSAPSTKLGCLCRSINVESFCAFDEAYAVPLMHYV
jgi:hypothetical protein